jgi:8-oxo-dGTP pyrophosphatase MutT (NUDIX family)
MSRIKCCGIILKNVNDQVLLVFGIQARKWSFPKGHIEAGETYEGCAHREFTEETGRTLLGNEKELGECQISKVKYFIRGIPTEDFEYISDDIDTREIGAVKWVLEKDLLLFNRRELNTSLFQYTEDVVRPKYNKPKTNKKRSSVLYKDKWTVA